MRVTKFVITLLFTFSLVFILNIPLERGGNSIPPLGKIMNPFTGFWQNAEPVSGHQNRQKTIEQLEAPARILYDERLVPHIFAENIHDAYFLQGFTTAKHRLWQMDIVTRMVSGRLSEVFGKAALNRDKLQRRRGLVFAAKNALRTWEKSPQDLAILTAYTEGVNAYLSTISSAEYPIEFKLMNYSPEPWTNLKSAILIKSMALTLCSREDDLEATNALHLFGREVFDFLYPEYNPRQAPVIPSDTEWNFDTLQIKQTSPILIGKSDHQPYPKVSPFLGSNNWAVSGKKTASGNPILCNDPHLNLTLPSIWYEIQIHTPEINAYGVSLPGFPGVIIGFNENVSWGMTNVSHDVLDWYQIKWANPARTKYYLDDQVLEADIQYETFRIKGGEVVLDTVRYTHWGPVVYESAAHPQQDMAMRWTAHDSGANEIQTTFKLSTSRNYEDYSKAVQSYDSPAQNIVFASKDGDIAIKAQGKYPLKTKEQGRFILDGSNSQNAWHGFIPKSQNPQIKNPARGFVSSANQHSTSPAYPYYYNGHFEDYRGRTLNRLLDSMQSISIEDMMNLQNNNFSLKAQEALPLLLAVLDETQLTETEKSYADMLKNWDYHYQADQTAPVLFDKWFSEMYERTWDEIYAYRDSIAVLYPEDWRTIELMENDPQNQFFDIVETREIETFADIALLSFRKMLEKIQAEENEDKQHLALHYFKQDNIPHLSKRITPFASSKMKLGGSGDVLNAIKNGSGPSWRMIVELGDSIQAYGVYPGGQSGNPGSPFYENMVEQWAAGKYNRLLFLKNETDGGDSIIFTENFNK